jgi:hypothetical protein
VDHRYENSPESTTFRKQRETGTAAHARPTDDAFLKAKSSIRRFAAYTTTPKTPYSKHQASISFNRLRQDSCKRFNEKLLGATRIHRFQYGLESALQAGGREFESPPVHQFSERLLGARSSVLSGCVQELTDSRTFFGVRKCFGGYRDHRRQSPGRVFRFTRQQLEYISDRI